MYILKTFELIREAFQRYPLRSLLIVVCMLLAGLSEGVGVAIVLPVLSIAIGEGGAATTEFGGTVTEILAVVGIPATLTALLPLLVLGFALKAILVLLAMQQIGFAAAHISTDLRLTLIRELMEVRWSYFASKPLGGFANAVSTEANRGGAAFTDAYTIIAVAIQVVIYLSLAFVLSWRVTLAAMVAGAVMALVLGYFIGMTRRAAKKAATSYSLLLGRMTDILAGIKPLKAMAAESRIAPLITHEAESINHAMQRLIIAKEGVQALREPIIILFLATGLYSVLSVGSVPFEMALMMGLLFHRAVNQIARLQSAYQQLTADEPFYRRLTEMIDSTIQEKERFTGNGAPKLDQSLRLEGVTLSFAGKTIIDDVTLSIPLGRITTLIGPSGAGKTTLSDLITGLYEPDSGSVLIDGVPLKDLDIQAWRQQIGYVPQEMFLFHDTVMNNITLGDPSLGAAETEAALRAAGAWEFVSAMKAGLNTEVGERGSKISGGERQRISIARALVRKPKLLILDEPTAAMDSKTEAAICATLRELSGEITILAVSHQPALVEIADRVYRIADGKAVSQQVTAPNSMVN